MQVNQSFAYYSARRFMGRTNVNTTSTENVEDPKNWAHFRNYHAARSMSGCGHRFIGTAFPRGIPNCARVTWNGDGFDYENKDDDEDENLIFQSQP